MRTSVGQSGANTTLAAFRRPFSIGRWLTPARRVGMAFATVLVSAPLPTQATPITVTVDGTATIGTDITGAFGAPGSTPPFVLTYTVDTTNQQTVPGGGESFVQSSSGDNPISAVLTINGQSLSYGTLPSSSVTSFARQFVSGASVGGSQIFLGLNETYSGDNTFGNGFVSTGVISGSTPFTTTSNLNTPYSYNLVAGGGISSISTFGFDRFTQINGQTSNLQNVSGSLVAKSITVGPGSPSSSSPPTVAQLALLSNDAYQASPTGIPDYGLLTHLNYGNGLIANIYGSPDKSQLVVAFQGTNPSSDKNLLVDAALGAGVRSALLDTYVDDATQLLTVLAGANKNANITLTGHSLGGALAQLLGHASGADTVVFDTPGIVTLSQNYAAQLSGIPKLGNGSEDVNYRLYGDQVSVVGTQIGEVFTVGNTGGPTTITDKDAMLAAHLMLPLATDLQPGSGITPKLGVLGPNFSADINNVIIPILSNGVDLTILQLVSAFEHYFVDPESFIRFVFNEGVGSPYINSVALPFLNGISTYDFRFEIGDVWSPFQHLDPGTTFNFVSGVDGFEFDPLNQSGALTATPDFFLFDITFSSSGTVAATLTQEGPSDVPEPSSLGIILVGLGWMVTRRRWRSFIGGADSWVIQSRSAGSLSAGYYVVCLHLRKMRG